MEICHPFTPPSRGLLPEASEHVGGVLDTESASNFAALGIEQDNRGEAADLQSPGQIGAYFVCIDLHRHRMLLDPGHHGGIGPGLFVQFLALGALHGEGVQEHQFLLGLGRGNARARILLRISLWIG